MAILLQANVWLKNDGTFYEPVANFAIVRYSLSEDGDSYIPYHAMWCYDGEVKFRAAQTYKYYERVRANPTYAVIKVGTWDECSDYDMVTRLNEKRTWKHMIDWQETIRFLLAELRAKWPVKIAGYDGPETSG